MSLKPRTRKAVEMATDENGFSKLTQQYIKYICAENGLFDTPHLNTAMYLHYKG